jgi:hypothetical protein
VENRESTSIVRVAPFVALFAFAANANNAKSAVSKAGVGSASRSASTIVRMEAESRITDATPSGTSR